MKFYYNGQLVRSSKNHTYTHAVINTENNACMGCRTSKENAEAIITSEIADLNRKITNSESAIKALESGKSGYYVKEGRRTWYCKFSKDDTVEWYTEGIERRRERIGYIKTNWQVVELEAR
jgi:hypothetical protein